MYLFPFCPTYRKSNSDFICPIYRYYLKKSTCSDFRLSASVFELSNNLRKLWEQHSAWTRMFITSTVFKLPDLNVVTERLLRNPDDFANLLKQFYGESIALEFRELLKEHLETGGQFINGIVDGNAEAAKQGKKAWYDNADKIAAFLSIINPHWSEEHWRNMMYTHLKLVTDETNSMLNKNYSQGVAIYDELENEALKMAGDMTEGIVKQFPERFSE